MDVKRMRDSELVNWNSKQESVIARYIESLLDILSINADGRVSTDKSFALDVFLKILSENVTLYGIQAEETKKGLIQRAFFHRIKKYKKRDVHTFRRGLAAEVRKYLSQPAEKYWILFPLHIAPGELGNARSITIFDAKLRFRSWDYLHRGFEVQGFLQDSRLHLRDRKLSTHSHDFAMATLFSPVLVQSEGRGVREAFEQANRSFDLFRWLINLQYQFRTVSYQWGGYPRPLGKLLPPPTYGVFNQDRSYNTFLYNTTIYTNYPRNTFVGVELQEARSLARRLQGSEERNGTLLILLEALEKYGQALDAIEWRLAFMLLWQILELVTLQSADNLNMKTVKSRVGALLGQRPRERDLLQALYKTRNSLVHLGAFPDQTGLTEVNLLKYIVEEVINALFSLVSVCPTQASLRRYYEHISQGDSELKDRRRIITNILRKRT